MREVLKRIHTRMASQTPQTAHGGSNRVSQAAEPLNTPQPTSHFDSKKYHHLWCRSFAFKKMFSTLLAALHLAPDPRLPRNAHTHYPAQTCHGKTMEPRPVRHLPLATIHLHLYDRMSRAARTRAVALPNTRAPIYKWWQPVGSPPSFQCS